MQVRSATHNDAEAIAGIYSQGIEDRVATFETRQRTAEDVQAWFDGVYPVRFSRVHPKIFSRRQH